MTDIIQYTAADMASQAAQGWRDGYAWRMGEGGPASHVMVPVEPTPEMLVAINWPNDPAGYRAMLAAAPQAPAAPDVAGLVEALEEITSPIKFMQGRLKEGERLNGMAAIQLAEDSSYLRGIAIAALATYQKREPSHD